MKHARRGSLMALLFFAAFVTCTKDSKNGKKSTPLNLSGTNVQRGEPLFVSTNPADNNVFVRWTIHPSANTTIMPANNQALALFAFSGIYGITASFYTASDTTIAYDSSSAQIVVNDSIYAGAPVVPDLDSLGLANEEITLVPISASDSGLVIMAKSTGKHNCAAYFTAYSWTPYGPDLFIDFNGAEIVERKADCGGAKNPAISYLLFGPFSPGTYNIDINLNNMDYHGTLTVNNTNYLFNWNYSNGVIISPTILKKQ